MHIRSLILKLERESRKRANDSEREKLEWEFWTHARESDLWPHLAGKFEALAKEEIAILLAKRGSDCRLRAYCTYNSDITPNEADLLREGIASLLYRTESATWCLSAGPNEYFKARFEALATRAGTTLGPPRGITAAAYWLHCVCVHLRRTKSPGLFACSDTGGIITSICESSAFLCCWLEKKALESCAIAPMRQVKYRKAERGDPEVAKRRALVRSNPNVVAHEMCDLLDSHSVELPRRYLEAGFRSWRKAYLSKKHRGGIDTLISKDKLDH
jgi:hypothetical protein